MRVSLFIDENDKYYHFNKGTWNYDLEMFETDLLITFGRKEIIEMVKSMNVHETRILSDLVKLVRFQ
ncbi:MAG: hypothetical protein ABS871_07250 [Methanobrevibacter sp.]